MTPKQATRPSSSEFDPFATDDGHLDTVKPTAQAAPAAAPTIPASAPTTPARRTLRLEPGLEPVPGYVLMQSLGTGGYGEVWLARASGGFEVALKFIRLDTNKGDIELRSLDMMKDIRHPHLLGMFGAWLREGRLIIAMERADRSLLERLKEAVAQGHRGIPGPELGEYMREAAKGIDHLNILGIVHRDIKPHNLLLSGGGVKVADFGLAKIVQEALPGATANMTPAYAAPELLDGKAGHGTDQYSLAIAYCQLRGNRLPFDGTGMEVMSGHFAREPDLSMVPPAEQAAVARALAKQPDQRWPSCRDFIEALIRNRTAAATMAAGTPTPAVSPARQTPPEALAAPPLAAIPLPPPVDEPAPPTDGPAPEEEIAPVAHGRSKARWLVPVIVLIFLILPTVALLLVLLNMGNNKKKDAGRPAFTGADNPGRQVPPEIGTFTGVGRRPPAFNWQEYESQEDGFKISFQGFPGKQDVRQPTPQGELVVHVHMAHLGNRQLKVECTKLPTAIKPADQAAALDRAKQGLGKNNLNILSSTTLTVDGQPALEVLCRNQGGEFIRLRMLFVGQMRYILVVIAQQQELLQEADTEKFLNSFKLLAPPTDKT